MIKRLNGPEKKIVTLVILMVTWSKMTSLEMNRRRISSSEN